MSSVKKKLETHEHGHKLTLCDTAAKPTLEAATSLYELHVRTHVGLATVAADWTTLTMVHKVRRALRGDAKKEVSISKYLQGLLCEAVFLPKRCDVKLVQMDMVTHVGSA